MASWPRTDSWCCSRPRHWPAGVIFALTGPFAETSRTSLFAWWTTELDYAGHLPDLDAHDQRILVATWLTRLIVTALRRRAVLPRLSPTAAGAHRRSCAGGQTSCSPTTRGHRGMPRPVSPPPAAVLRHLPHPIDPAMFAQAPVETPPAVPLQAQARGDELTTSFRRCLPKEDSV
jgi:hypothetical protein